MMKSMIISDEDKRRNFLEKESVLSVDKYPYGLKINITPETAKKLGIMGTPKVGQMVSLLANAEVVSVHKDLEKSEDHGDISFELQITELDVKGTGEDASSKLYGGE